MCNDSIVNPFHIAQLLAWKVLHSQAMWYIYRGTEPFHFIVCESEQVKIHKNVAGARERET